MLLSKASAHHPVHMDVLVFRITYDIPVSVDIQDSGAASDVLVTPCRWLYVYL